MFNVLKEFYLRFSLHDSVFIATFFMIYTFPIKWIVVHITVLKQCHLLGINVLLLVEEIPGFHF